jgi:hypothetical protein
VRDFAADRRAQGKAGDDDCADEENVREGDGEEPESPV